MNYLVDDSREEPTLESHHEVVERILVLLVGFGIILVNVLLDCLLDKLDGSLKRLYY